MRKANYNRQDLDHALDDLPLQKGGVVFVHSNVGYFGRLESAESIDDICRNLFEAIMARLGPEGTLVVPTFTYSFSKDEVFDRENSPSVCGAFSEWVRKLDDARRSLDPFYSVAVVGHHKDDLIDDLPRNSFCHGSLFDRLYQRDGVILNMNFDAGSTFIHYAERELKVPYRYDKRFSGFVVKEGQQMAMDWSIWVRYLSDNSLVAAFEAFNELAVENNLFATCNLGRGKIGVISCRDTFELVQHTLTTRPYFLTQAEVQGITSPVMLPEQS